MPILTMLRRAKHLDEADKRDYLFSVSAPNQILAKKEVKYILWWQGLKQFQKKERTKMKRIFVIAVCLAFFTGVVGFAMAAEKVLNPLEKKEVEVWKKACSSIPAERNLNTEQFKKLYDDVMAGKEKAYLIDTRTHPEFYAFHIPNTDHVHAGHMYTIPGKIKDKDAKIVVWCRTHKRQCYVAEKLVEYGYTNVWAYGEGIVGWIKAGYEVANQFTGLFKVTQYHKEFKEMDKEGKPMWRIREFHPY